MEGPLGADRFAGEDRVHGHGASDGPGETEEPARGRDQVALHLGQSERRPGTGDDQVGREHYLQTAGRGQAVHDGHQGLGPLAVDDAAEPAPFGVEGGNKAGLHHLQVGSGAENG